MSLLLWSKHQIYGVESLHSCLPKPSAGCASFQSFVLATSEVQQTQDDMKLGVGSTLILLCDVTAPSKSHWLTKRDVFGVVLREIIMSVLGMSVTSDQNKLG